MHHRGKLLFILSCTNIPASVQQGNPTWCPQDFVDYCFLHPWPLAITVATSVLQHISNSAVSWEGIWEKINSCDIHFPQWIYCFGQQCERFMGESIWGGDGGRWPTAITQLIPLWGPPLLPKTSLIPRLVIQLVELKVRDTGHRVTSWGALLHGHHHFGIVKIIPWVWSMLPKHSCPKLMRKNSMQNRVASSYW